MDEPEDIEICQITALSYQWTVGMDPISMTITKCTFFYIIVTLYSIAPKFKTTTT